MSRLSEIDLEQVSPHMNTPHDNLVARITIFPTLWMPQSRTIEPRSFNLATAVQALDTRLIIYRLAPRRMILVVILVRVRSGGCKVTDSWVCFPGLDLERGGFAIL